MPCGGVKNTVPASNVSIYDIVPGIRGSTAFSVENSILSEKQKAQEYSGYARTFSQKALNEELMENYPDSRFLWQQAAKMDEISRAAREKAAFYQTVVQTPSAAFAGPGTAPKPVQTGGTKYRQAIIAPVINRSRGDERSAPETEIPQAQTADEQAQTKIPIGERVNYVLISAGVEKLGNYAQSFATTGQFLEDNFASNKGYIEQLEIDLQQAIHERDAYIEGGLLDNNPLVLQINKTIQELEANLEYVQSGQMAEARDASRQKVYDVANSFYGAAEEAQNRASEGLGTVGEFLVETGITGSELLIDAVVGMALVKTGVPKAALANQLVQSFGNGAHKALDMGGGSDMQVAYGLTEAVMEYISDKISLEKTDYDNIVKKFTRGVKKDLRTNMTLREIVASFSLQSLGESLETLCHTIIDPVYDLMNTGETDMGKIEKAWDESLKSFVAEAFASVVSHK